MKETLKTIGQVIFGGLIVLGLLFLFSPSYPILPIINICIYSIAAAGLYAEWRKNYYPNYGIAFKLLIAEVFLEIFAMSVHYDLFGWYGLLRIDILLIADFLDTFLILSAIYVIWWNRPRAASTRKEATIDELIWNYIWNAKIWEKQFDVSHEEEESENAKKARGIMWLCYLELKERGRVGAMRKLLGNPDRGVRIFAALQLLWSYEAEALEVLNTESKGQDKLAKIAGNILERWKNGKLEPDKDLTPDASIRRRPDYRLPAALILIGLISCIVSIHGDSLSLQRSFSSQQLTPTELFSATIMGNVEGHASPILHMQESGSNPSWWMTQDGHMVFFYSDNGLASYLQTPTDTAAALSADQNVTQYVLQKLADAGYKPDPANSATSTTNQSFGTVRLAFISSDGTSHCVVSPPDPTHAWSQIAWTFVCADTQDITQMLQNDLPFFVAMGDPRGVVVQPEEQQGDFANLSIFDEGGGIGGAIVMNDGGEWKVIWKTTPEFIYPTCSLVQKYGVPKSVYEQCLQ